MKIDFSEHDPIVHIEMWQTPQGKRRYKIVVDTPWVAFSRDSVIRRISRVAEMLTAEEENESAEREKKGEADSQIILRWFDEHPQGEITVQEVMGLLKVARSRARAVLQTMVSTGILSVTVGAGRGSRSRYKRNYNRTQSVPSKVGTVSTHREPDADFDEI